MLVQKITRLLLLLIWLALLTLFTQVGGVIYLLCIPIFLWLKPKIQHDYLRFAANVGTFIFIYLIFNIWLIPALAKPFGKVPLPFFGTTHIRPLHIGTYLLNRHYVTPEMRKLILGVSKDMNKQFPGTDILYLDANFPLFRKYPLFPHLSHNDGKKLDIALFYKDSKTSKAISDAPSPIGYGVCEAPLPNEINMPDECDKKGFWQYNFMSRHVISQQSKKDFVFDSVRTKAILMILAEKPKISRIFIEPHLKIRLGLMRYSKIVFHGCQAVRHDDHIHLQIQ
jgi:hypothetical protein